MTTVQKVGQKRKDWAVAVWIVERGTLEVLGIELLQFECGVRKGGTTKARF